MGGFDNNGTWRWISGPSVLSDGCESAAWTWYEGVFIWDDDKKVTDSKRSGIFTSYFRLQTRLPRTCHVSYPPGLRPVPAGVGRAGGGRAEF